MSNYEDMRDWQMREQYGDDYITPTRAYTANEWIDSCEEVGTDVMMEVMERDMARFESEQNKRYERRIADLQALLDENGIDYE